ncbi:MAG: hypothetical protein ACLP29_04705 [Dissulfurispiraceae bacterium]
MNLTNGLIYDILKPYKEQALLSHETEGEQDGDDIGREDFQVAFEG